MDDIFARIERETTSFSLGDEEVSHFTYGRQNKVLNRLDCLTEFDN